jgi:hypothetical protein
VVRIAITQDDFDAIVSTMSLGNVGFKNATHERDGAI